MPSPSAGALDAQGRLVWTGGDVRARLRVPDASDDKRTRGTVAVRTGSDAYPGAAVLGIEAAWRAGAGYVRYIGPRRPADLVLARRPETVVAEPASVSAVHADAWVIGSGTDPALRPPEETAALRHLLAGAVPVVVDAGALDLLPADAPVIATPHEGEFARLRARLGLAPESAEALQDPARRAAAVRETAEALGGTVLLKGATTLVAGPGAAPVIAIDAGTGWLAAAGTGDVLAGVIGALVAADRAAGRGSSPAALAASAAWLHGRAGRLAAHVDGGRPGRPLVALDVAEALPAAIAAALADVADDMHDHRTEEDHA
ncbi:ADP-dependent NAD(P)H-hydrate dehydratase [Microbacterium azadirachtae]|uniref:ADP-dependent NAD(P)H-hydrate dehydratase n=1 Tax=Microbacterium azadirachtae TaxID=582680 RepID=UPI000891D83B|nr:ADP/ATP-dependent (S)-NAD(P)H-hydrate dehydratase [Microbacterium azadirachtae]SDM49215.1 yjeF C-terminal region, hydroxyethylthiazole kinase-related [Microbacterium azadirachtae]SEG59308.1 yjeF C-terminal region, hydroxyethylthiazole kinase-related [Microbacterium azadirachtae]SEG62304.1 yjeF C-terminal region, hydroxyethylthiazole kinase-related [Microbacterium azadirachtae]